MNDIQATWPYHPWNLLATSSYFLWNLFSFFQTHLQKHHFKACYENTEIQKKGVSLVITIKPNLKGEGCYLKIDSYG